MLVATTTLALALGLIGCAPTTPNPTSTTSPTTAPPTENTAPEATIDSVSFDDGASLPADTDISWGDGFAADAGWEEVADMAESGRWGYRNADGSCLAAFRGGSLGAPSGMTDLEATDALVAQEFGGDPTALGEVLGEGFFLRYESADGRIANRQVSLTVDGSGIFVAVRAFVAQDYSVHVTVTCEGTSVDAVAAEVLSKNVVSVAVPG